MPRRLPAEWESQSAVQLTFPHADTDWAPVLEQALSCFVEIAEAIAKFQKVLVVCQNAAETRSLLAAIPDDRLILVELPSNDTWARDHGGITIEEDGEPAILDFIFNGWGHKFAADKDNLITHRLFDADVLQTDSLFKTGMVLEGGGIESDGNGVIMTTAHCQLSPNRNPHLSQDDIEEAFRELFGAEKILWLENGYLAGDDTDSHVDTLARFCDENTIAYVKCPDEADEHFEALLAMETELRAFTKLDGSPYALVALPMPEAIFDDEGQRLPATYANFLIINGAVLVPIYDVPQDLLALEILQTCFPDREVIGINCRALILEHGSLHCVTMQYPEGVLA
jgi:agmatine deiminase